MPTAEKSQTIDDLAQKLRDSLGAVIVDYRGLSVAAIGDLRRQLSAEQVEFLVAKNTLLRIAADRVDLTLDSQLLIGPTAVAFGWEDEAAPARLLSQYMRRNRNTPITVKGGIIGGSSLNAADIGRVADLPGREILLSQLLGGLQSPMAQTLSVLQAPLREVAGLAQALLDKMQASEAA